MFHVLPVSATSSSSGRQWAQVGGNQHKQQWDPVDPDFNWNNRRTGVREDYWTAGLSIWGHYNATALETASTPLPVCWTQGRMCKFLRQVNETAFRLHSLYEKNATGLWGKGFMKERTDGLMEHTHLFRKSPFRIEYLPCTLPEEMLPEAASTRVTIVQPDAATFSGPRWLPTCQQARTLLLSDRKDMPYSRLQFYELWLTETIDGQPEARKMGLFCEYNGITGELIQLFRMREVTLPRQLSPTDPSENLDLVVLDKCARNYSPWTNTLHLQTKVGRSLLRGDSIVQVLISNEWSAYSSRAVRTQGPDGPEVAFCVESSRQIPVDDTSPAALNPNLYYDCRFGDGCYARVPKSIGVDNINDYSTECCLEFGCVTLAGNFHRLLARGNRRSGLEKSVYERWSFEEKKGE